MQGSSVSVWRRAWRVIAARVVVFGAVCVVVAGCTVAPTIATLPPFDVVGDAISVPLAAVSGDAARGRTVMAGRDANCLLCHAVPESGVRSTG
jgi:hypothetical protein